jgi:ribonuclease HI
MNLRHVQPFHESIGGELPRLIELTEKFDHPAIRWLATHIKRKRNTHVGAVAAETAIET